MQNQTYVKGKYILKLGVVCSKPLAFLYSLNPTWVFCFQAAYLKMADNSVILKRTWVIIPKDLVTDGISSLNECFHSN